MGQSFLCDSVFLQRVWWMQGKEALQAVGSPGPRTGNFKLHHWSDSWRRLLHRHSKTKASKVMRWLKISHKSLVPLPFPPQTSAITVLICSEIIKDEDFLFLQERKPLFFHSCRDPQENTKYPETADETEGWSWELSCHHQKHQIRFGQWCKSLHT